MRRLVFGLLTVVLGIQSSGVSLAATQDTKDNPVRVTIPNLISPMISAIGGSQMIAQITGSGDRYALMHMKMPHVAPRLLGKAPSVTNVSITRLAKRVAIAGIPEKFTFPIHPPRQHTLDPLAMHRVIPGLESSQVTPHIVPAVTPVGASRTGTPHLPILQSGPRAVMPTPTDKNRNRQGGLAPNGLAASDVGAGINPWWTFATRAIPGLGTAMVNAATGNLLVQSTDVDIPERGVDLAFTRTYNSQSQHDANGDDGSEPSIFGNLWTNTYDAHIVFRYSGASISAISVYDSTGTRCDYTPDQNGDGGWTPCTGQYATLEVDPSNPCMYWWIKKDGTSFLFHTDAEGGGCTPPNANLGRLYEIFGRNSNNNITFNYSFSGQKQTSQNITQIVVSHSDGQSLTLNFAKFSGINELSTITYPKPDTPGETVKIRYSYDTAGDLLEVDKPGNDATPNLSAFSVPAGDLPQTYGYTQPLQFLNACGPRATISLWQNQPNQATDGSCLHFDFDGSVRLSDWITNGISNPQIRGSHLQPSGPTGWVQVNAAYFVYGASSGSACGTTLSGTTTTCDTDGHSTIRTTDTSNRVTRTQVATADAGSGPSALVSTQTWDTKNDLTASQTPQEYANDTEDDISYDSNGNPTKVQLPQIGTSSGSIRPTYTASYDNWNNITSLCDAVYNAQNSGACPTTHGLGNIVYVYDTNNPDIAEPNGKVTDVYNALNYHTSIIYNYNSPSEPGDYGLPTKIKGETLTQLDGSTPTPQANMVYDQFGNVTSYGRGLGNWTMAYNNDNWRTSSTDPDNVTARTCFNQDGSLAAMQSALQYKMDGYSSCGSNSLTFAHDTDGNVISIINHFGNTAGTTLKFYDGLERLVEVDQPQGSKWRYFFDLTQNNGGPANLTISGWSHSFSGYGNLYKVQRNFTIPGNGGTTWNDITGTAYDALNRSIQGFQRTPGSLASYPGPIEAWTTAYDANSQYGLIASGVDPMGDVTTYAYDGAARLVGKSFSDGTTPNLTYVNDPNGRVHKATSSVFGDETLTYDPDGHVLSYAEGGGPSALHPTVSYSYYPNGWRSSLTINAGNLFNSTQPEFTYDYQMDGLRKTLAVAGKTNPFSWSYTSAGRVTTQSDPWTGNNFTVGGTQYPLAPKSFSYDLTGNNPTGALTTLSFPIGAAYQNIQHDAEGATTAYSIAPPTAFTTTQNPSTYVTSGSIGYDNQGRFTSLCGSSPASNGCQQVLSLTYQYGRPDGPTIDPYTGAALQTEDPSGVCGTTNYSGIPSLAYDNAGRETTTTTNACSVGSVTSNQRTYDAQNYITADTSCALVQNGCQSGEGASTNAYGWAALGDLRTYSTGTTGNTSNYRFHWDGMNLLFVTDANGNLIQLNVEKLAIATYNPSNNSETGFVVYDRDFSGTCIDTHGNSGDGGINTMPSYSKIQNYGHFSFQSQVLTGSFPGEGTAPASVAFDMIRLDGYQVGSLSLQGARGYDASLEQWTVPDSFKGVTDNPTTLWAYTWNAGNPITNLDFSGNDPAKVFVGTAHIIFDQLEILEVSVFALWGGQALGVGIGVLGALPFGPEAAPAGLIAGAGLASVLGPVAFLSVLVVAEKYYGVPAAMHDINWMNGGSEDISNMFNCDTLTTLGGSPTSQYCWFLNPRGVAGAVALGDGSLGQILTSIFGVNYADIASQNADPYFDNNKMQ